MSEPNIRGRSRHGGRGAGGGDGLRARRGGGRVAGMSLRTPAPVSGGVYVPPAVAPDETAPAASAAAAVERWVASLERPEDCLSCGACALACDHGAIALDSSAGEAPLRIDSTLCSGCGDCVEACPQDVLALRASETGP